MKHTKLKPRMLMPNNRKVCKECEEVTITNELFDDICSLVIADTSLQVMPNMSKSEHAEVGSIISFIIAGIKFNMFCTTESEEI